MTDHDLIAAQRRDEAWFRRDEDDAREQMAETREQARLKKLGAKIAAAKAERQQA